MTGNKRVMCNPQTPHAWLLANGVAKRNIDISARRFLNRDLGRACISNWIEALLGMNHLADAVMRDLDVSLGRIIVRTFHWTHALELERPACELRGLS